MRGSGWLVETRADRCYLLTEALSTLRPGLKFENRKHSKNYNWHQVSLYFGPVGLDSLDTIRVVGVEVSFGARFEHQRCYQLLA